MFRLLMALGFVLLLWLYSLLTHTVHSTDGARHVLTYGPVAWMFSGAAMALCLGFAALVWKWMHDKVVAAMLVVGSVFMGAVLLPQILCARVELTETDWRHRREWPHQKFNADILWKDIAHVTKVRREDKSFGQKWHIGYEIVLRSERQLTFPSSDVLSAAESMIDQRLMQHEIPAESRDVLIPAAR